MAKRNVLFIMCDQLRFDYLSCAGHPYLQTPNIDALAARGVRFTRAYVQSPVCGPSRMSTYTGRYMRSHGANWNGFPLRIGEPTLGDHLRGLGIRTALVGKTHMTSDDEGMQRLGIDPGSRIGVLASECGFEPYDRDDGLHPAGRPASSAPYNDYLRSKGYAGANPWETWANSGQAPDGGQQNGWLLVHADKAARVAEEDSETPHITRRAMDFIAEAETDGRPWCLHLSDHDRPAQPAMKIRRSTPASPSDVPAYYIRLHCQLKSYQSCHRDRSRFKAALLNKHSRKTKTPGGRQATGRVLLAEKYVVHLTDALRALG